LSLLGHVYFKRGDFGKAEKLLQQSLRMHSEADLLNDPCLLMDLFCLAAIKQAGGDEREARRLYEETAMKIRDGKPFERAVVAQAVDEFLRMADSIPPATSAATAGGAPPEPHASAPTASEPLPLPAMEMREAGNAGDIWQQQFQTGLARMKVEDAEYDELVTAYLNFESAYRLAIGMFADDDMRLIATIKGLADASTKLRLFDQAEALYRQAISQAKANKANAAAAGNSIRLALGFMYIEAGTFRLAKSIFDEESTDNLPNEAEPLRKRVQDALHVLKIYDQAQNLLSQAEMAEKTDDLERAAKLANNALSALKQAFPPHHAENAKVLRYRGTLLERLGHADQAAELLQRAERIEKSGNAQQDEWLRRTADLPRVELEERFAASMP
jgi:tetratricopeptide (TPR) repeat protein